MSPWTNRTRGPSRRPARLASDPAYVSLSTTTRSTRVCSSARRTKLEPMNPAPPVTHHTLFTSPPDDLGPCATRDGRRCPLHVIRQVRNPADAVGQQVSMISTPSERFEVLDQLLPIFQRKVAAVRMAAIA